MCEKYAELISAIERGLQIKKIYNKDGEYDGFDLAYDIVPSRVRRHRHGSHAKKRAVRLVPRRSIELMPCPCGFICDVNGEGYFRMRDHLRNCEAYFRWVIENGRLR